MPALPDELPRNVILAWRRFIGTPEAQLGLDFIRRQYAPSIKHDNAQTMLDSGIRLAQHHSTLDAVEHHLTFIAKPDQTAESPGLVQQQSPQDDE